MAASRAGFRGDLAQFAGAPLAASASGGVLGTLRHEMFGRQLIAVAIAAGSMVVGPTALAQSTSEKPPPEPPTTIVGETQATRAAGTLGGALLGSEVVVLGEALAHVDPVWAYLLGGGLGAAVGGYAGLLATEEANPDVSAYIVGAGALLLLPTIVWVGNLRRHPTPREPVSVPPGRPHELRATAESRTLTMPAHPVVVVPVVFGHF